MTTGDPTATPRTDWDPRERVRTSDPSTVATAWGLDEVVDLGELGADREAGTPIDELVASNATDGTLLYFPPGRYRIDETVFVDGDDRIGLLGDEATIVPTDGFASTVLAFGYPEPLAELLVRGLTFDYRAEDTGGRPVLGIADDLVLYRDLSVRGPSDVSGDIVRLDVTTPEGIGVVDRLSLPDGSPVPSVTGCEVGDNNHGDVSFYDCHIAGFPDNGLYADPPEGSINVFGGFFRNNGVAGVRITTSEPSLVRGVRVRCDDADGAGENMRGIRLRGGYDHVVEDCVVELLDVTSSDGAVTIASELASATVRNCHLHVDADGVNAIRVKSPNADADDAVRGGRSGSRTSGSPATPPAAPRYRRPTAAAVRSATSRSTSPATIGTASSPRTSRGSCSTRVSPSLTTRSRCATHRSSAATSGSATTPRPNAAGRIARPPTARRRRRSEDRRRPQLRP